jgi:hypothetical protein
MDKILFVVLFAMLAAWLYSVCRQEDGETCTIDKNSESSACENEVETESPGYEVEKQANPCS